jgi:hypothetical protein
VFDHALADLAAANPPTIFGKDRVALSTHRVELTSEEARARTAIERVYRDGGLTPPDAAAIAAAVGAPAPVADRMLKLLQRQKVLVRVDVLLFHNEALKQLKAEMRRSTPRRAPGRYGVATFKERFGRSRSSRSLAQYLDRERHAPHGRKPSCYDASLVRFSLASSALSFVPSLKFHVSPMPLPASQTRFGSENHDDNRRSDEQFWQSGDVPWCGPAIRRN